MSTQAAATAAASFRRTTVDKAKSALAMLHEAAGNTLHGLLILEPIRDGAETIADYRCTAANPAAARMTGLSEEALVSQPVSHWSSSTELLPSLRETSQTGDPRAVVFPSECGGQTRWLLLSAAQAGGGLVASLVARKRTAASTGERARG